MAAERISSRQALAITAGCAASFALGFWAHARVPAPEPPARPVHDATAPQTAPKPGGTSATEPTTDALPKRYTVESRSKAPAIQKLTALGYVDGVVDVGQEATGVVLHDEQRAQPGLNLYSSRTRAEAQLIDMQGAVVHSWRYGDGAFQHVEVLPDGALLVLIKDEALLKLDRESHLLWQRRMRAHHDLTLGENGEILVLTRKSERLPWMNRVLPTLVDYVTVLSPDGKVVREHSLLEAIRRSPHGYLLPSLANMVPPTREGELDVLHTNHVERLDGALASRGPMYEEGNLLVSIRNLNAVAILDGETLDVDWLWGPGNVTFQHHAVMLQNGRILLFDNGDPALKQSRVLEVEPRTNQIMWMYSPPGFFSEMRGSNQRLENGNTLITESDKGQVLEVTPRGEVVWKFVNPHETDGKRVAIWRMTRFSRAQLPFLAADAPAPSSAPH